MVMPIHPLGCKLRYGNSSGHIRTTIIPALIFQRIVCTHTAEHQPYNTSGSLKRPSELHHCEIPMDVKNVVDFDTMYERIHEKNRIKLPELVRYYPNFS